MTDSSICTANFKTQQCLGYRRKIAHVMELGRSLAHRHSVSLRCFSKGYIVDVLDHLLCRVIFPRIFVQKQSWKIQFPLGRRENLLPNQDRKDSTLLQDKFASSLPIRKSLSCDTDLLCAQHPPGSPSTSPLWDLGGKKINMNMTLSALLCTMKSLVSDPGV